jgi:HAD superfamily hydrolase (TIGR01509 family)
MPVMHSPNRPTVILDVDGTLVDSERDGHRVAFNRAFEEFGLDHRWSVDEYGDLLSTTGGRRRLHRYLAGRGMPDAERDRLVPRLHERKTELLVDLIRSGAVPPRPGVTRLLDDLDAAGARLAVATTGSSTWVRPLLDLHFGPHRFAAVVTGDEVRATKPDPEVYLLALARLGDARLRAVAVEDSPPGLASALAAGLRCAVVVNDYTRDADLVGADLVVDGFAGLDAGVLLALAGAVRVS